MAMTLEQVRDALYAIHDEERPMPMRKEAREWAEVIGKHLTQPAQAVDVGFDNALNDAGWAFIGAMPVPLPGPVFNNVKTALKAAIEKWLATRALAGEQAGWRDGVTFASPRAAESAAKLLLERFEKRACDSRGVDCCIRCNAVALSRWVLAALPASPTPDKETQR